MLISIDDKFAGFLKKLHYEFLNPSLGRSGMRLGRDGITLVQSILAPRLFGAILESKVESKPKRKKRKKKNKLVRIIKPEDLFGPWRLEYGDFHAYVPAWVGWILDEMTSNRDGDDVIGIFRSRLAELRRQGGESKTRRDGDCFSDFRNEMEKAGKTLGIEIKRDYFTKGEIVEIANGSPLKFTGHAQLCERGDGPSRDGISRSDVMQEESDFRYWSNHP